MTKTLLYGGSFDPPHIAHVALPHDAMEYLGFERVLYVPAHQSPLKDTPQTSDSNRLAMLGLALQDCPWAEISTTELDRGGISYTIDTIKELQQENEDFRLLIGADQWAQCDEWKSWEEILQLANPAIIPRDGYEICDDRLLPISPLPAVSTDIRTLLRRGMSIDMFVPPAVCSYITEHQLYQ